MTLCICELVSDNTKSRSITLSTYLIVQLGKDKVRRRCSEPMCGLEWEWELCSLTLEVPPVTPLSAYKCPLIASSLHSSRFIRPHCVTGDHSHIQSAAHEAQGLSTENNQGCRESKLLSVSCGTQSWGARVALTTHTRACTHTHTAYVAGCPSKPCYWLEKLKRSTNTIK